MSAEDKMFSTLCKVCIWWDRLGPESKLSGEAAHDLANIEMEIWGHCMRRGKDPATCPFRFGKEEPTK